MRTAMLIAKFPPLIGGTEIQCQRLAAKLVGSGHHVTVLTQEFGSITGSRWEDGIEVVRFRTQGPVFWSSFLYGLQALIYLFKNRRFDVLYAHMLATPAVIGILAGKLLKTSVLIKIAGARRTGDLGTSRRSLWGRLKILFFMIFRCDIVCPDKETEKETRSWGTGRQKVHRIPNGVDENLFLPSTPAMQAALRQGLGLPSEKLLAIYAGRWARGKGLERLLEICASAERSRANEWCFCL